MCCVGTVALFYAKLLATVCVSVYVCVSVSVCVCISVIFPGTMTLLQEVCLGNQSLFHSRTSLTFSSAYRHFRLMTMGVPPTQHRPVLSFEELSLHLKWRHIADESCSVWLYFMLPDVFFPTSLYTSGVQNSVRYYLGVDY